MSILLKPILQNQTFLKTLRKPHFLLSRTLTSSSTESHKKPFSVFFEEVVGLKPKPEPNQIVEEGNELKRKLLEIETKITELKKVVKTEETEKRIRVYKEVPLEMVLFVKLLNELGYLNKASFVSGEDLDLGKLDDGYARNFVKFAAVRFGQDYQEIAKWLSGKDLKNVALFGCPNLEKRAIFAAKTLRKFFDIPENSVCDKCVLREKCKFPNQSVWDGKTMILHLSIVTKVITLYPLDLTHPELQVPQEVQDSISRLLTEIQKLSGTVSTPSHVI